MQRLLPAMMSAATAVMLFSATTAGATTYRATLSEASSENIVIVHRAPWRCTGNECVTSEVRSRPEVACGAMARELGALTSFVSDSTAFTSEELADCNGYARD